MPKIKISDIKIGKRHRALNNDKVKELADSIKEIGLINPIKLDIHNNLVAGLHRLEASKFLGETEIEYTTTQIENSLKLELIEIDENLVRSEITYIERGEHFKRRKEIYEELHPETKPGIFKGNQFVEVTGLGPVTKIPSFAEDTAKKIGLNEKTIRDDIRIASKLNNKEKDLFNDKNISRKEAIKFVSIKEKDPETAKNIINKIESDELKPGEIQKTKTKEELQKQKEIESMIEANKGMSAAVTEYKQYLLDTTGSVKNDVCIMNPRIMLYCEDCKFGFDVFKPKKAEFCPYCGKVNILSRDDKWYPMKKVD